MVEKLLIYKYLPSGRKGYRSVFSIQNKAGKTGIFWEKESVPKKDKKFGYRKKEQRFPIRRHVNDTHQEDRGFGTLTPDDAPPPPKPPAKNFIKRNREHIAGLKQKKDQNSTVTLTQEQLNAILKSVGKVAGGNEKALKISIDNSNNRHEISIESPQRNDDDDDYDDQREKRRPKKKSTKRRDENEEEEPASIYSLLGKKDQPKAKSQDWSDSEVSEREEKRDKPRRKTSWSDSEGSEVEEKREKARRKTRRETKSKRRDEDDYDDRRKKDRYRSKQRDDDDDQNDNDRDNRRRQNRSKYRDDDIDSDRDNRTRKNRSKHRDDYDSDDDVELDNRHRRSKPKQRDYDEEDDDDYKDRGHKGRNRNSEKSDKLRTKDRKKERKDSKDRDSRTLDIDVKNVSGDKLEPLEVSPRDKVGLPNDLSWRHMTKAERLRLTVARNKLVEEEEKKEEDRIQSLMVKYGGMEPSPLMKPAPEKKRSTKSDPDRHARHERIHTEESNYTDYRRGRRSPSGSRSRTPDRSRTPERSRPRSRTPELHHSSPYSSPKADKPPGIPRQHMTLAEKKRIEWERDRVESVQIQRHGEFDPWGRPGAGAPLRTRSGHIVADYKNRQENMRDEEPIPEESAVVVGREDQYRAPERRRPEREPHPPPLPAGQDNVPHAMRSSFVFGGTTEVDKFADVKEQERKQWLAELEKQIEEKKIKDGKNKVVKEEETWADKLGQSHRKLPFPEQPKETVTGLRDSYGAIGQEFQGQESQRVQSAPEHDTEDRRITSTFIRGQNVPIDPATRKEMEEKRRRYLEHQTAVRAQVEEKERLKRLEKEKKLQEDLEEERKLQAERDMLQKQYEMEQQKIRQKEQQRQAQVNMLKAAMDEAQAKAMQEKYQRKMQHLEKGGHDTSKLRENLEGFQPKDSSKDSQITSRIEQLHTRRERDILRAQKMQELSDFHQGQTVGFKLDHDMEKDDPRIDQQAKITPRSDYQSELPGGVVLSEPQYVPGLDLATARTTNFTLPPAESHREPVHEPYVEERVLTPSRFRRPSKPWSDPSSPRREFGTQTMMPKKSVEDADTATVLNSSFNRDISDVQIEYKLDKGKKVRVISASKDVLEKHAKTKKSKEVKEKEPPTSSRDLSPHMHHHEHVNQQQKEMERKKKKLEEQRRKGPVKAGSRPQWNYKNSEYRKAAKQSERDPFYAQKKRESEYRRLKREQKLLAMVEANKAVIPDYVATTERARTQSPHSDYGGETPREIRLGRRSKSHSPKRPKLEAQEDYLPVHTDDLYSPYERTRAKSPVQEKSDFQSERVDNRQSRPRNRSPPIPAIKHRYEAHSDRTNVVDRARKGVSSYDDVDPLDIPVQNGDFVPFTRTIDVLDPAKAEEPLPLSREATRILNARKVYHGGLQPDKYGNKQNVFQDKQRLQHSDDSKNPILNPGLVTDHPTTRQDQILMQLSTLKQSLMQRQRELETFSPTDLEKQNTYVM